MSRDHLEHDQRQRLADAFVDISTEKGYEAADMKAICLRAGVPDATFGDLFGTKEALFLSVYDAGTQVLVDATRTAVTDAREARWPEQVEAALGAFLGVLADNPGYAQLATVEIHKAGPVAEGRLDDLFKVAFALLSQARVDAGANPPLPGIASLVMGGIYARINQYVRAGRVRELRSLAPVLTSFLLAELDPPNAGKDR